MKHVALHFLCMATLVTSVFGLTACGQKKAEEASEVKIVGGHEAPSRPFMASLMGPTEGRWLYSFCGGTFIRPDVVLTAGHCVEDTDLEDIRISGGTASIYHLDEAHTVGVRAIEIHPGYHSAVGGNDLALVFLEESEMDRINSERIAPASLSTDTTLPETTGSAIVAGWGQLSEDDEDGSNTLLEVSLPIVSLSRCRSAGLQYWFTVSSKQICAGDISNGGVDSCYGDSGGPLFINRGNRSEIAGVVSWGNGCARARKPGVYTRVSSYVEWINSTIADQSH